MSDTTLTPLAARGEPVEARDLVAGLRLHEGGREGRPRVVAAMIASLDGRATLGDRSVGLGNAADRQLLRELRTAADAVLVGTRTLAAERYANLLDDDQRALRERHGRPGHPVIATISRGLDLPRDIPLFAETGVPVQVYTEATGKAGSRGAQVETQRLDPLTLPGVLEHLAAERGARLVVCEGGPGLLRELVAQDGLDDLLLTVAPLLAAGDGPTILAGEALDEPARLRLHAAHRAGDHVVLHLRRAAA